MEIEFKATGGAKLQGWTDSGRVNIIDGRVVVIVEADGRWKVRD
jgi:hypothetical protein